MAEDNISKDIKSMSFEVALEELQKIVGQLESGQGKLEEAIQSYERGAQLKQHCENKLRQAKQQIDKISLGPGGAAQAETVEIA